MVHQQHWFLEADYKEFSRITFTGGSYGKAVTMLQKQQQGKEPIQPKKSHYNEWNIDPILRGGARLGDDPRKRCDAGSRQGPTSGNIVFFWEWRQLTSELTKLTELTSVILNELEILYGQDLKDNHLFPLMSICHRWSLLLIGWQIEGWMDWMIVKIPSKLETFFL